jgi:hypothetical protein
VKKYKLKSFTISEEHLQIQCNDFLKIKYPELDRLYWFNSLQSIKLSIGAIAKVKRSGGLKKNLLDFYLLKNNGKYCGLVIELKKESPYKLNGQLKQDEHLENQRDTIDLLLTEGYYAKFCWDLKDFQNTIRLYLDNKL